MKKILTPILTALIIIVAFIAMGIGKLIRKIDNKSEL